eukprot:GHVU01067775.1.p1 GENE.GHVU01067775.1~~GHVU01067775.1.p1  ORF type:complete len:287 (-),score=34.89 GHVU01067775.1:891-1751(-)
MSIPRRRGSPYLRVCVCMFVCFSLCARLSTVLKVPTLSVCVCACCGALRIVCADGIHPFVKNVDPGPMKARNDYNTREVVDLWKDVHSRFKVVYSAFDCSGSHELTEESFVKFVKPSEKAVFLLYQWTLEFPDILEFATGVIPDDSRLDSLNPTRGDGVRSGGSTEAGSGSVRELLQSLAASQTSIVHAHQQQQRGQHMRDVQAMLNDSASSVTSLQLQRQELARVGGDCTFIDEHLKAARITFDALQKEMNASLPGFLFNSSAALPHAGLPAGRETTAATGEAPQ